MNKRINFLAEWYLKIFGQRVRKVPLDIGASCPGRDGTFKNGHCFYCNVPAFSPYMKGSNSRRQGVLYSPDTVLKAFEKISSGLSRKGRFKIFLPYLNAFTPTHCDADKFAKIVIPLIEHTLSPGLALTTRPDSINDDFIAIFSDICNKKYGSSYLGIELGLQSCNDKTLKGMNRGHDSMAFSKCAKKLVDNCPDIDLTAHLIFGFPGETREDWLKSAKFAEKNSCKGLKFHQLHAFPETPLYSLVKSNELRLPGMDEYIENMIYVIERIRPETVVHRLSASSMVEVLPKWTLESQKIRGLILKKMEEKDTWQGKFA